MNRLRGRAKSCAAALLIAAVIFAAGCAGSSSRQLWTALSAKGTVHGFAPLTISTPPFALSALLKAPHNGTAAKYLVVYIEGDGRVLTPRGTLSADPTPTKTLVFDLACLDPAPAVLYLARLGQYQPQYAGAAYQTYWSTGRFAPEAVRTANEAVSAIKTSTAAKRIYLVGYSGGGGLACLLAARRDDVAGLVTLAGLLDHDWWTRTNNYPPLTESLNPADFANQVAAIPQIHFYGANDRLVSPEMSARFASMAEFKDIARVPVAADHGTGWQKAWPGLLRDYVLPLRQRAENKYK